MGTAAGIGHQVQQTSTILNATPMRGAAAQASDSGTSETDSATISANDFLTLLVTEMKNQDPTANNDPNQYVNQLVQVNSLQQLISINQTLTDKVAVVKPAMAEAATAVAAAKRASTANPGSDIRSGVNSGSDPSAAASRVGGNLSVPGPKAAATRVAQALSGTR